MSTWTKAQKQQNRTSHPDLAIAGARRAQLRYMPALWVLQQLVLQREPYADSRFANVEWVSLIDDDAYVMYANLQAVLQGHDTSKAVFTGHVSPDTWLPDHVDGSDIELGVSTNTSFVAGGPGAYFTKRVLEKVDLELCVRESLPGAEFDGWQSDWIVAQCLKTQADVLPMQSGHGNFVQFACNEDGVVLPCEISASSEDPQSFDDNPAVLHPVKSSDQMMSIHKGLIATFGSSTKHTISRAGVREHLWSAANQEWRDAARLRRELKEQRALHDDGKGHHTSLQKVSTLQVTDPTSWDAFGTSLVFEDDLLMTSASSETVGKVSRAGAVYIYKSPKRFLRDDGAMHPAEWSLATRLTAPAPMENAYFGASVAMHRDTIVVGAFGEPNGEVSHAGAVYVFAKHPTEKNQWDMVERLSITPGGTPLENLYFGMYVSVHDNDIVVGCPYARTCAGKGEYHTRRDPICDGGVEAAGAVVTYKRESNDRWKCTGTLTLPEMAAYDFFGQSVFVTSSARGDRLIAGAYGRDVKGTQDAGAVYTFSRSADGRWQFDQELTAHSPAEKAFFGISLVGNSNGDTLLVGATGEAAGDFEDAGAAYVFDLNEKGAFGQHTRLAPPEPRDRGGFGLSVTLYDDTIVVGSKGLVDTSHSGHSNGSAITMFRLGMDDGMWAHRVQVEDPHVFGSHFGYTVSMRGSTTAVGAPFTKSGSMASWFQGTLASRPKSPEFRVHGSVVILEEEQASQPQLDDDGCWDDHSHHSSEEPRWDPITGQEVKPAFCFPHVFLLGAQKAATTSMFELLHDLGMACPANTLLSGVPRTNNTLDAIKFQNVTHGK